MSTSQDRWPMRVLFVTTQGLGHAMPLLPFAGAARDAGHDVVLAGPAPTTGGAGGDAGQGWVLGGRGPTPGVAAGAGIDHAELAFPDDERLAAARRLVAG